MKTDHYPSRLFPVPSPTKSYDLEQSAAAGDTNPLNTKYKANGKRVTREQFDAIRAAAVRHDTFTQANVNGVRTFYSVAYVPFNFFLTI